MVRPAARRGAVVELLCPATVCVHDPKVLGSVGLRRAERDTRPVVGPVRVLLLPIRVVRDEVVDQRMVVGPVRPDKRSALGRQYRPGRQSHGSPSRTTIGLAVGAAVDDATGLAFDGDGDGDGWGALVGVSDERAPLHPDSSERATAMAAKQQTVTRVDMESPSTGR